MEAEARSCTVQYCDRILPGAEFNVATPSRQINAALCSRHGNSEFLLLAWIPQNAQRKELFAKCTFSGRLPRALLMCPSDEPGIAASETEGRRSAHAAHVRGFWFQPLGRPASRLAPDKGIDPRWSPQPYRPVKDAWEP